jgi:hypothetical protein
VIVLPTFAAERIGVGMAAVEFSRWGWMFREQSVLDYGIDAHVEPCGEGVASGQLIALQIKSGRSFFDEPADGGWIYRGDDRHLWYWLRHCLPVILLLHDPDTGLTYWEHVTTRVVEYTDAGWKMLVPSSHILSKASLADLAAIAAPAGMASADPVGEACALLPPSCAQIILRARAAEPGGALRLASMLADGREAPRLTAESILSARPSWLAGGNGQFEVALATYAGEHGYPDVAANAMERAAEYGEQPDVRLLAFAALYAAEACDASRARALVRQIGADFPPSLLTATAAAIVESLGQPGPAAIPGLLTAARPAELASEPTCLAFLGVQTLRRREVSAAVRYLQEGCSALPTSTSLRLQLGQALLARVVSGQSAVEAEDMRRIEEAAQAALDQRRQWSGPSSPALAMLIRRHMLVGAFKAAARLATPQPEGEALEQEASDDDIVILGTQAALTAHDRVSAQQFAARAGSDHARDMVAALLADPDLPTGESKELWLKALSSAPAGDAGLMALHRLACLGQWPLPGMDELRADGTVDDVTFDILAARSSGARGNLAAALTILRPHASATPVAAEVLVDVLQEAERFDEALDEAARGYERFGESILGHKRLNLLALADHPDEAATEAIRLLARPDTAPELRLKTRQRLIGHYAYRGDWPAVEEQARAALTDFPGRADLQWCLIGAVNNRGQLDRAWDLFAQFQPPITTTTHAGFWLGQHAHHGFIIDDINTALDLLDQWPEDTEFQGQVLTAFLGAAGRRGPNGKPILPDLDQQTQERFQARLASYTSQNPSGPIQAVPGDAQVLAGMLRAQLAPQVERFEYMERLVRDEQAPLSALAAVTNTPYASALLQRATGVLIAVTSNPDSYASELTAADAALDGKVVIHSSALAVASILPARWAGLRGAFADVSLSWDAWAEFQISRNDLLRDPGTRFMIGYDLRSQALNSHQFSQADHAHLSRRFADIDSALRSITMAPTPDLDAFAEYTAAETDAALSPFALAATAGIPLWCDDVLLRGLAEHHHIATFGTVALLETLIESGRLPDTLREDILTLARGYVGNLLLTSDELDGLAAESGYQLGPATTIVSRAVFWADPSTAREIFLGLVGRVLEQASEAIAMWVAAACAGVAVRLPYEEAMRFARSLAIDVFVQMDADDGVRARLMEAAEQAVNAHQMVPQEKD